MILSGRAWKFGDDISTDLILPGRFFPICSSNEELFKHVFSDIRPDFLSLIGRGDFIVGGENFGLGSSREQAPAAIKAIGVDVILAKSFARIFYRNCVNLGIYPLVCDTDEIHECDELEFDTDTFQLRNLKRDKNLNAEELPEIVRSIIVAGGLITYLRKDEGILTHA